MNFVFKLPGTMAAILSNIRTCLCHISYLLRILESILMIFVEIVIIIINLSGLVAAILKVCVKLLAPVP